MTLLKYPATIDGSSDYMLFEFGEYKTPIKGGKGAYTTNVDFSASGNTVALNMPSDIGTQFTGAWAGKDTTSIAQVALNTIQGPVKALTTGKKGDLKQGLENIFKNANTTVGNFAKSLGDDALRFLGEGFSNLPGMGANLNTNDILQLTSGIIINPNTELLYGGMSLRTHGYTFKLIPQSKDEADQVIQIVSRFKEACLPKISSAIFGVDGRNFINIPEVCRIKFMKGAGGENEYLPKYKPSGITSVNVSYITDGNYMSFSDGKPIGVQLTVSLTELKLVFKDDVTGSDQQAR